MSPCRSPRESADVLPNGQGYTDNPQCGGPGDQGDRACSFRLGSWRCWCFATYWGSTPAKWPRCWARPWSLSTVPSNGLAPAWSDDCRRCAITPFLPPHNRHWRPPRGEVCRRIRVLRSRLAGGLLTDDVFISIPPLPFEYEGREPASRFFANIFGSGRRFDLVPTWANGQPASGPTSMILMGSDMGSASSSLLS